ncbi:TPA: hypothetical protein ACLEV2_001924 [Pseudomonas aeruginosa]
MAPTDRIRRMKADSPEFNGRPLIDELRRLAGKNPGGDCYIAMTLAADALESGDQVDFKGRSLVDALHFNIRNAMGDSKAAIRSAIDVLSSKPQTHRKSTLRCSPDRHDLAGGVL